MRLAIAIAAIVVFSVVFVLVKGMHKREQRSNDSARISAGEAGEAASDGGGDE